MRQQMSFYRGACAIIERGDGKVLLNLRDRFAWVYPDCWAFFGGGVESGESPYAGLCRELLEEINFVPTGHKLFNVAWHRKSKRRVLDYTFRVSWRSRHLRLGEGRKADWFSLEEALALASLPPHERHDLTLLQKIRQESHSRIHNCSLK